MKSDRRQSGHNHLGPSRDRRTTAMAADDGTTTSGVRMSPAKVKVTLNERSRISNSRIQLEAAQSCVANQQPLQADTTENPSSLHGIKYRICIDNSGA